MQQPLFVPNSNWRPPAVLPELGSVIALDTETRDPHLMQTGPSFKRGEGEVVGIALANKETSIYLPIAHESGDNLDKRIVCNYVANQIAKADEVIMANATYDLGWLGTLGIEVPCPVRDVQVAEALLDEERYSYSLDNLSKDYLGRTKDEEHLQAVADAYAISNKGFSSKGDMWRLAARHVGQYAEIDARNTFDIYQLQLPKLHDEDLLRVWELECEVTKALHYMTKKGVPVDLEAAQKLRDQMFHREKELHNEFNNIDIWSTDQLARYCDGLGISYRRTEKGNPSITKEFLTQSTDPRLQRLNELRGLNRLRKVYIEDTILKGHYRGHIHADFRQTASDHGGTRSGRLASSNPNLQQVPKRSEWGKKIRSLYVAYPDSLWCKADYSSQEPRLQTHYALELGLPGADGAKQAWEQGKKLYTFFEEVTGLDYDTCKMLCLGISYGMGKQKMAATLGTSIDECEQVLNKFHKHAPFLQMLFERCMAKASSRGYIKTILGRRSHFEKWQSDFGSPIYDSFEEARKHGNRPTRAFVSKGLNRLIQGSAADQSKLALVAAWKEGMDVRLPVHDEINIIYTDEKEPVQLKEIMEHVIELRVPTVADVDLGPTWQ